MTLPSLSPTLIAAVLERGDEGKKKAAKKEMEGLYCYEKKKVVEINMDMLKIGKWLIGIGVVFLVLSLVSTVIPVIGIVFAPIFGIFWWLFVIAGIAILIFDAAELEKDFNAIVVAIEEIMKSNRLNAKDVITFEGEVVA